MITPLTFWYDPVFFLVDWMYYPLQLLPCFHITQMGQLISFEKQQESQSVLPLSKNYQSNPESRANFLSQLLFWWTGEILDVGSKAYKARGGLEVTELFPLVQQDQAAVLYKDFKVGNSRFSIYKFASYFKQKDKVTNTFLSTTLNCVEMLGTRGA